MAADITQPVVNGREATDMRTHPQGARSTPMGCNAMSGTQQGVMLAMGKSSPSVNPKHTPDATPQSGEGLLEGLGGSEAHHHIRAGLPLSVVLPIPLLEEPLHIHIL